jgi:uncharacterized protein (DUF433 family)
VTIAFEKEVFPVARDADGTVRVAGTSVPVDAVVYGYLRGESPEEIHSSFPAVSLADVYAVVGFYLRHRAEVDRYLRDREEAAEQQRAAYEAEFPPRGPDRAELLRRWEAKFGAPFPNKRSL